MCIGTAKYEIHHESANGHYSESGTMPNGSYKMSPPPLHYNNHHQQNIYLQESTITWGQHYNYPQQNVHLQQPMMHQPPTYLIQHTTPRNYNPVASSTTYKSNSHYTLSQTNGQHINKQHSLEKYIIALPKHKIPVNSPILWELSQEIMEWKFLGRNLNLEEEIIDEIDYNTRPNKTRDKALKVLTEWVNSSAPQHGKYWVKLCWKLNTFCSLRGY